MAQRFKDKVAVVTGASSGMGYAAAMRLASEGAKIVGGARSVDKLKSAMAEVQSKTGSEALAVETDASKPADLKALMDHAVDKFGKLDICFINAGVAIFTPIMEIDEESVDKLFSINAKGVLFSLKYAMACMKEHDVKGAIVVNSSATSMKATAQLAAAGAYSATKAAVDMLVKYAAIEGAEHGIRVNSVNPGVVKTNIMGEQSGDQMDEMGKQLQLMPRAGNSDEVAALVAFLLSDEASFVTGSNHVVDGGWSCKA